MCNVATIPLRHYGYFMGEDPRSHEEKDLGVIITDKLEVTKQCAKSSKKANAMLMINRAIKYKIKEEVLQLYKSLFRPI